MNFRLLNLVPVINNNELSFLHELNNSTETTKILQEIRSESMERLIKIRERSMTLNLKNLNAKAFELLNEFFALNNLKFNRISWDDSSAQVVEFIGLNDRVRPVNDWIGLKKRLSGDFRCYGVFHDALNVPVSFAYVRLYRGLASNLHNLLNDTLQADQHDSCVFYSISSPMKGLNGIEFGSKLIKSVVKIVQSETSQIKTFATFSPIPNFRDWLVKNSDKYQRLIDLKSAEEVAQHEAELIAACEEYLSGTVDPVARFHYRNGATRGPIRFAADPSPASFKQSYGIQVNYIYSQ